MENPARLPAAPPGRVALVDLAFASGDAFRTVTEPFIEALGTRLAIWIDHHEHVIGWGLWRHDLRFCLVPSTSAHACPELVTKEVVRAAGAVDVVLAHADFDGLLSAVKFLRGGEAPYAESDEDARAVDSPGRGHTLSERGKMISAALDESRATESGAVREALRQAVCAELATRDDFSLELHGRLSKLAQAHQKRQQRADALGATAKEEAPGVGVIRAPHALEGSERKAALRSAEERWAVGVVIEPGKVTAATFRADLDLAEVPGLDIGRADYRFGKQQDDGSAVIAGLAKLIAHSQKR